MNFKQSIIALGLALTYNLGTAAEAKEEHYLLTEKLTYGVEIRTGYDSNMYSENDEEGSFVLTICPEILFNHEFANGPLNIAYSPEFRWYEARESETTEIDHILHASYDLKINNLMNLRIYDNYADVESNDVSEIDGVTSRNNDYRRNIFGLDYTFEFDKGRSFVAGYKNEQLEFDEFDDKYRNLSRHEIYYGANFEINSQLELGAKVTYGNNNFYDSQEEINGVVSDRDSDYTRFVMTTEYTDGPWTFIADYGFETHEVTGNKDGSADDNLTAPYIALAVNYHGIENHLFGVKYDYRTVAGYEEYMYFATQSKVGFTWDWTISERVKMTSYLSYENLEYKDDYSRDLAQISNDTEEWVKGGFKFVYVYTDNLDFIFGVSTDHMLNAAAGSDTYTSNQYDFGLIYAW